jgi:hypothetical protein
MITNEQISLLIKEGHIASTCLGQGLTALRKASMERKDYYYQAFFLLTIGLERLMKLIIIHHYRGTSNTFPDNKILKIKDIIYQYCLRLFQVIVETK